MATPKKAPVSPDMPEAVIQARREAATRAQLDALIARQNAKMMRKRADDPKDPHVDAETADVWEERAGDAESRAKALVEKAPVSNAILNKDAKDQYMATLRANRDQFKANLQVYYDLRDNQDFWQGKGLSGNDLPMDRIEADIANLEASVASIEDALKAP